MLVGVGQKTRCAGKYKTPLPPYSPELNPVEHIWDEVREKWFPNLVFDSLDVIEDRLVEALVDLERIVGEFRELLVLIGRLYVCECNLV